MFWTGSAGLPQAGVEVLLQNKNLESTEVFHIERIELEHGQLVQYHHGCLVMVMEVH